MGLSSRISMKLTRNMVLPAFLLFLIWKLITPGDNLNIPRNIKLDQIMRIIFENRIVSCRYREWQRHLQTSDVPRELKNWFPRLMLMEKNQRACWIPSLIGMQLFSKVEYHPQKLKLLRNIFRQLYSSGNDFAIEFNSNDSCIIVLKFWHDEGKVMMEAERHDRITGMIDHSIEEQIILNLEQSNHTIDLKYSSIFLNPRSARMFYTTKVSLSLKQSSEMFGFDFFNLETYNSVKMYKKCAPAIKRCRNE